MFCLTNSATVITVTLHLICFGSRDPGFPGAPPGLNLVRVQPNFSNRIKLFLPVQSPSAKIFRFPFPPNHLYHARHPGPREGRIAIVTDVGCGMRWTRQRLAREGLQGGFSGIRERRLKHADERCCQRTAKSCGSDAPTLASSFVEACRPYRARTFHIRKTTVAKEPGHREEHDIRR
jgi:hypothetical protein